MRARYGLKVGDVNDVVQAAIGGQAVTQIYEGERWFDLVVRFLPEFRRDIESIGNIVVSTPMGPGFHSNNWPHHGTDGGVHRMYRENNERYIPIKFSVRGQRPGRHSSRGKRAHRATGAAPCWLPDRMAWGVRSVAGRKRRVSPRSCPSLCCSFCFSSTSCLNNVRDAFLVLAAVPFSLVGGVLALLVTGTHFSISAAVRFISLFGVAVQGAF